MHVPLLSLPSIEHGLLEHHALPRRHLQSSLRREQLPKVLYVPSAFILYVPNSEKRQDEILCTIMRVTRSLPLIPGDWNMMLLMKLSGLFRAQVLCSLFAVCQGHFWTRSKISYIFSKLIQWEETATLRLLSSSCMPISSPQAIASTSPNPKRMCSSSGRCFWPQVMPRWWSHSWIGRW